MLLAIETSCDETSVAIVDINRFSDRSAKPAEFLKADLISSQTDLHVAYGGVVPELAAREHLQNLPILIDQAFQSAGCRPDDLSAVAVTRGPGLNGCLLVGLTFAKSFALARNLPLLALNHLEGHLFASDLLEIRPEPIYPALLLLVSGGHTELVLIKSFREYELVARTKDDAVGEAFDKSATLLGLPYPGGPQLAALAARGDRARFPFPVGMPEDDSAFSFSGVKTAVRRRVDRLGDELRDPQTLCDVSAGIETALVEALLLKLRKAVSHHRPRAVHLSGGVAANTHLQERLRALLRQKGIAFFVPPSRWCTDNAAMIGVLGARILLHNALSFREWHERPLPKADLGPNVPFDVGAMPRWPLA
ncbi:MAG: tRNA (adenosine(37)-N6)-threonylcarbamoyltransferase complex transferase subunit TsaD [Bdellovibrionota bacterium]